jgi:hypothetical protein
MGSKMSQKQSNHAVHNRIKIRTFHKKIKIRTHLYKIIFYSTLLQKAFVVSVGNTFMVSVRGTDTVV